MEWRSHAWPWATTPWPKIHHQDSEEQDPKGEYPLDRDNMECNAVTVCQSLHNQRLDRAGQSDRQQGRAPPGTGLSYYRRPAFDSRRDGGGSLGGLGRTGQFSPPLSVPVTPSHIPMLPYVVVSIILLE